MELATMSHAVVARAGAFLEAHGREVDRARFAFHFGAGSQTALLEALGHYQNEDGGFGHALEVDISAPDSNPFATELALTACLWASVPAEAPQLRRAEAYLERTQMPDGDWRFSDGVLAHEIAPWFAHWEWPNLNPACTTSGLARQLGAGSPQLHERAAQLFERLARTDAIPDGDFYAVRPYAYYFLAETPHPRRDAYRDAVANWLLLQHREDAQDGNHFFEYIRTPDSPIAQRLPSDVLHERLNRLVAEQSEDGGWPSPYNAAWRPWVTTQNLLTLQAFGRV
jgi:hypothetical protein